LKLRPNKCDNCFKLTEEVHRCGKCLTKNYCSKDCQQKDWEEKHQKLCKDGAEEWKVKGGLEAREKAGLEKLEYEFQKSLKQGASRPKKERDALAEAKEVVEKKGSKQEDVVERSPMVMERSPTMVERSPMMVKRSPSMVDRNPTMVERSPTMVKRSPTVVERSPMVVERNLVVLERSPVVVEKSQTNDLHHSSIFVWQKGAHIVCFILFFAKISIIS